MRRFSDKRKTTPKVRDGTVQRKNRHAPTPDYYNTPQEIPVLDRERPGKDHRHLIRKKHLIDFISILPDWDELSVGLDAIVLAHEEGINGWHRPGIVAVCAWPRKIWEVWGPEFYFEHREILKRLGVPCEKQPGEYLCKFTEATARAYQLLHVLLHELGHHHDRMTTRSKEDSSRGEGYAEQYANRYSSVVFNRYLEVLGLE
ncbi:MAG: hypothetical protein JSU63_04420 [Phycisphaerales bacterium]|nr:MAG: hypothetical protein JSU63_04420 [Phycisphaerales bacterium]